MTFLTSDLEKVSTANSNSSLSTTAYNANSDTVAAVTSTTITLGSSASTTLDAYTNKVIEFINGPAKGIARQISAYPATTKVATLSNLLTLTPNIGDTYIVHQNSGSITSHITHKNHAILGTGSSSIDDFYNNCFIKIINGTGKNQIRKIIDYIGSTKKIIIDTDWEVLPDSTSIYVIYGESGTASSGTANTIVLDGNQTSAVIAGLLIEVYSGTGIGQVREIQSISTNTVTVTSNWDTNPDGTSKYIIYGGWTGSYEAVSQYALSTVFATIDIFGGERSIFSFQYSSDSTGFSKFTKCVEYSNINPFPAHTSTNQSQYWRVDFIGLGTTLTGAITTIHHKTKNSKITTFINENITDSNDCDINRSILVAKNGKNKYQNIRSDNENNLNVRLNNPLDAFGNVSVSQLRNIIELTFLYNANLDIINNFKINSGDISQANAKLNVFTGTTTGSYSNVQSKKYSKYYPGLGISCKFTAVFTQGVANTTQVIGLGNNSNGFFFGYNGENFGILRRTGGLFPIYTLQITSASTGAGTIVITLNGQTKNVTVGASDTVSEIARLIVSEDFLNVGNGWIAYEDNDTVIFVGNTAEPRGGSYSLTLGTATGVAGSFTVLQGGVSPTETWTLQDVWNIDRADGTQMLPVLDTTKGNVYNINFQWLGFGRIKFQIEDPKTGMFVPVHVIEFANSSTTPSVENPNVQFTIDVNNGSTTSNIVLSTPSVGVAIEGTPNNRLGIRNSAEGVHTENINISTKYNVLTLRNNIIYNSLRNTSEILLENLTIGYSGTSGAIIRVYQGSVLNNTSGITWTDVNINRSIVSYTSDFVTVTNGRLLYSIVLFPNQKEHINMTDYEFLLQPGEEISVEIEPLSNETGATFFANWSWIERQ